MDTTVLRRVWAVPEPQRIRRRDRLKMIFEARKATLNALKREPYLDRDLSHSHRYGAAVVRYNRARRAWRFFRGHD